MNAELVQVSYPPMEPFHDLPNLPDIEGEEAEVRRKREEEHITAYEKAQIAYVEAYERRKALLESDSCRLDGCPHLSKAGLKFCRRHTGIRRQITKATFNALGPGTKVKLG